MRRTCGARFSVDLNWKQKTIPETGISRLELTLNWDQPNHGVDTDEIAGKSTGKSEHHFDIAFHLDVTVVPEGLRQDISFGRLISAIECRSIRRARQPSRDVSVFILILVAGSRLNCRATLNNYSISDASIYFVATKHRPIQEVEVYRWWRQWIYVEFASADSFQFYFCNVDVLEMNMQCRRFCEFRIALSLEIWIWCIRFKVPTKVRKPLFVFIFFLYFRHRLLALGSGQLGRARLTPQ